MIAPFGVIGFSHARITGLRPAPDGYPVSAERKFLRFGKKTIFEKIFSSLSPFVSFFLYYSIEGRFKQYTLVASFLKKDYAVAIPDPGEQERALTGKNEIIMAVPAEKLDDLMAGLSMPGFRHNPDPDLPDEMEFDFPRPPFYNKVFALWGMEEGKEWSFSKETTNKNG